MNAINSSQPDLRSDMIRAAILGHAIGDALGVPVEFLSREEVRRKPVTDMRGFGTHQQPAGTWSDDTSLTLCLAESLCNGLDLDDQARWFEQWLCDDEWTARGEVFDVGVTTHTAIFKLKNVADPRLAGPREIHSNENGSLMRILPLALYLAQDSPGNRIDWAMSASCLTHGHIRSQLACGFFVDLASRLMYGDSLPQALKETQAIMTSFIEERFPDERLAFAVPLTSDIKSLSENNISGSGYVIHSLGASLWCCLNSDSFEQAVLKAVNLGEDTDTTAAITGGLAGLMYGIDAIPERWLSQLARLEDIQSLCERFEQACVTRWKEQL